MLFISGLCQLAFSLSLPESFQSRNRDAFHFRLSCSRLIPLIHHLSFNLVIEMLFISGKDCSVPEALSACFNLVIEMLFISGGTAAPPAAVRTTFQSRNRDAFHFRMELGKRLARSQAVSIS